MIQFLLFLIVVLLWSFVKPKRDWYLVEVRICTEAIFGRHVFVGNFCDEIAHTKSMSQSKEFAECYKNTYTLKESGSSGFAEFTHTNGSSVYMRQTVFKDINAAILFYDSAKLELPYIYALQKVYMWQATSRFRSRINLTLPLIPPFDAYLFRMLIPAFTLISSFPEKGWSSSFPKED